MGKQEKLFWQEVLALAITIFAMFAIMGAMAFMLEKAIWFYFIVGLGGLIILAWLVGLLIERINEPSRRI